MTKKAKKGRRLNLKVWVVMMSGDSMILDIDTSKKAMMTKWKSSEVRKCRLTEI